MVEKKFEMREAVFFGNGTVKSVGLNSPVQEAMSVAIFFVRIV